MIQNDSKRFKTIQNDSKRFKTIQNDSERFKKVINDALLFIIARFDSKQLAVNERFPILP